MWYENQDQYDQENDPHYYDNHPNNRAYAESQGDPVYDDYSPNTDAGDPAFAAIRPILRHLPGFYGSCNPDTVTNVETLAEFLLDYNASAQDENASLRETITDLRSRLSTERTRANVLDDEVRRLQVSITQAEFAAKYPGQTVEDVVLEICKANGLGTDRFMFIAAIKDVRARFGNGLKEAKDLVDAAKTRYGTQRTLIDPS